MDDIRFMREALSLAERGRGLVAPNPLVGCVIVKDEQIVGRGHHRKYGACHAEVAAIRDAKKTTCDATMYVTLQPCNHFGKTPPCTDAVISAGIKRLVVAAEDPNPKTKCGEGLRKLERAGIEVSFGVLREEAVRQNEVYFYNLKSGLPFVALKLAVTLDGKIADFQGESQWITADAAREYVHYLRGEYSAILVGQRTVQTDNPALTCRVAGRPHPLRVVLDPELNLPTSARVFKQPGQAIVFCAPGVPTSRKRLFRAKGINTKEVGIDHDGLLIWPDILSALNEFEIASVMVEGGAKVTASALTAGVVNKVFLFVAPMILGGGISFSEELVPRRLDHAITLKEWRSIPIGRDLLIEAYL